MENNKTLHIVDNIDEVNIDKNEKVVFLNKKNDNYINQLDIIEDFTNNQELLKNKLLDFNSLVMAKVNPFINKDEDFRYILTFLFFEKSPYKTDYIYLFYKLNIIIDYIEKNDISSLKIYSTNKNIVQFFHKYSQSHKIDFYNNGEIISKLNVKNIVMTNKFLSSLYIIKREIKKISKSLAKNTQVKNKLAISYYPNYFISGETFISKYFSEVSKLLHKEHDWLFIYADDINKIKSEEELLKKIKFKNFNFLDAYLGYKDIYPVIKKFFMIHSKIKQLDLASLFIYNGVNYYDILIDDWSKSLSYSLLDTMVFECKFSNFFNKNKYEEIVYLMEYQPWEFVMNKVLDDDVLSKGIVHSTLRANLLNYFYPENIHNELYTPKLIGTNSDYSLDVFLQNGYKKENIYKIEAQRFMYLADNNEQVIENNNILITTSIDYDETKELLEVFASAYHDKIFDNIYIKAHPDLPIKQIIDEIGDFPIYKELKGNMSDAFNKVKYVYTANSSSVLLESVWNKKITITLFSLKTLPMPAVNENPFLFIVTSKKVLKDFFDNINNLKINSLEEENNLLFLENNYKMWESFLNAK